jgi:hypothetical protein
VSDVEYVLDIVQQYACIFRPVRNLTVSGNSGRNRDVRSLKAEL